MWNGRTHDMWIDILIHASVAPIFRGQGQGWGTFLFCCVLLSSFLAARQLYRDRASGPCASLMCWWPAPHTGAGLGEQHITAQSTRPPAAGRPAVHRALVQRPATGHLPPGPSGWGQYGRTYGAGAEERGEEAWARGHTR
eukprot:scaffold5080_cov133-Isochrysis_galbana.AAC.2